MHIVAHCFNMQNLYEAKQNVIEGSLENKLSNLPSTGDRWVNPITNAPKVCHLHLLPLLGTIDNWVNTITSVFTLYPPDDVLPG